MPRPPKSGLPWFPEDSGRRKDFKIRTLLFYYGPLGYTIYDFCLQFIYENGYYIEAPIEQVIMALVQDIGSKWVKNLDLVEQIIHYCAEIGLFDHALLQQNVITSVGVQKRYDYVTARSKADKSKYWLLDKNCEKNESANIVVPQTYINVAETPINDEETPINDEETQQDKMILAKIRLDKIRKNKLAPADDKSSDEADKEIFISIPLNDKSYHKITNDEKDHYKELYPAVNVEQELRSMCGWCEANPTHRKTKNGIRRFINSWLNKAQNQGGKGYGAFRQHSDNTAGSGEIVYENPNVL